MRRANDNFPDDISFSIRYLETGGLGEIVMATDAAYQAKLPKVISSPDVILALCILAQEACDAREKKREE